MSEKREFDPLKGSWPDPDKIMCRDCVFRDKTEVVLSKKIIKCGITKNECEIYQKPNYKPTEILLQNAECDYYVNDSKNGR